MTSPVTLNPLQRAMLHYAVVDPDCYTIGVRAGTGSGKSFGTGLAAKTIGELYPPDATRPPVQIWLTDTMSRAESVVLPICRELLGDTWRWHGSNTAWYWKNQRTGAVVWVRYYKQKNADAQNNPIEGIPYACAVYCEESQTLPASVAGVAAKRLRQQGYRPRRLFVGLPRHDAWWISEVDRVREARREDGDPKWRESAVKLFATSMVNAPNLGSTYIQDLRATMSPQQYRAEVMNEPCAPEGAVYPSWEPTDYPAGNIVDVVPPAGSDVAVAIDYGDTWPHVLFLLDDGHSLTVVDELAPDNTLPAALGQAIMRRANERRWNIWRAAGDPGARYKSRRGGVTQRQAVEEALPVNIRYPATARRDILLGIERVSTLVLDGTGERRLLCSRECWDRGLATSGRSFAKAVMSYRWPHEGGERPWKDDRHDHAMDALRYYAAVYYWDVTARPDHTPQRRHEPGTAQQNRSAPEHRGAKPRTSRHR